LRKMPGKMCKIPGKQRKWIIIIIIHNNPSSPQDHSTEWICRSVTFDHQWKICDLFAVNGTEQPYFLLDYQGRDYFEWVGKYLNDKIPNYKADTIFYIKLLK
jgi:hypothetical protein